MNLYRKLLQNSFLVFIASVVLKAVNVFAFILITRKAGLEDGGVFSLCTSYLVLFSSITWGFDELLTRQISQNRLTAASYFKLFIRLRPLFSVVVYLVFLFLAIVILKYPLKTLYPLMIMTAGLFTDGIANTSQSLLSAFEQFSSYFWASLLSAVIRLGWVVALLFVPVTIITLCWVWTISSLLSALILFIVAYRVLGGNLRVETGELFRSLGQQVKIIAVFLVIGFFGTVEYQTDVVILSAYKGDDVIGLYNSVSIILFSLAMIAQAYRMVVYPVMARYEKNEPEKIGPLCTDSYDLLWAVSLPMAAGIAILAPKIIPLIYGSDFQSAVLITRIIIWSIVFIFLNVPNSRVLLASEYQKVMLVFVVTSTGLNIILNFILIPDYAAVGAAVARLFSTTVYFVISFIFINRHYSIDKRRLSRAVIKSTLAVLVMALGVWSFREQPLILSIPIGVILYGVSLFILRRSDFLRGQTLLDAVNNKI